MVCSVLLLLLFSSFSSAQTAQERHAHLKTTMESGDRNAAVQELNALRSADPGLFTANNYDYLLARLLEKRGDSAGALSNYHSVAARGSVLTQYAFWHLAQLARSTGDLVLEREHLRHLITTSAVSLLRGAATMRLGHSFLESQDYAASISALRPLVENTNDNTTREALGLIAQAYLKAGKQQEARETFQRLLMKMPDASRPDDFALAAVRGLDALDSNQTKPSASEMPQLTESEHLLRASVYQFNRDFDAARLHYLALVARYPESPTLANGLYQIGRGFYLEARYEEALKYFERVLKQFPSSMSARDALAFTAGAYNRMKRTDDALSAYKQFIQQYPDAASPERSYLNIIDTLHEAGRYKEALEWVQQTRTRFRNQLGDALALFAQARIHLAQSQWQAVVADTNELGKFSNLGGIRVPGGTTQSEITFLRGYALEQLGRTDEAISEYLGIPDGRNEYYGRRATQRLLAIGADARTHPLTQARANGLRAAAEKAINGGQAEPGRRLAQDALRLTEDAALRDETLKPLRRAYDELPVYKFPSFDLRPLGRQVVITPVRGSSPTSGSPAPGSPGRQPPLASIGQPGRSETVSDGVPEPSHRGLADELIFLGLYDEGVEEFAALRSVVSDANASQTSPKVTDPGEKAVQSSTQSDLGYTLALYSMQGGMANRAVRFAEQVWKNIPDDFLLELAPREMVDLLYPLPYRESLLKHSPPRGVDPRLVVAVARQESRFQPEVKSVAAARGLMQFIPATAIEVSGQLKLADFEQDDLYNPDTAILFGSQYLAGLLKQFPEMPEAVAASYNSGPENVSRWVARSHSNEPIRYVPEIGFPQTKDYVFKVMTNFWVYKQLYDEKLERR